MFYFMVYSVSTEPSPLTPRTHNTLNAWIYIGSFLPSFSLVAALFLLFLVRIFRYGAKLQQEADETL